MNCLVRFTRPSCRHGHLLFSGRVALLGQHAGLHLDDCQKPWRRGCPGPHSLAQRDYSLRTDASGSRNRSDSTALGDLFPSEASLDFLGAPLWVRSLSGLAVSEVLGNGSAGELLAQQAGKVQ
jgi:hypothetical protein